MKKFLASMMPIASAALFSSAGCQHACQRPCLPAPPPAVVSGPTFFAPPVNRSIPAGPVVPAQALPQNPVPLSGGEIRSYPPALAVPPQPSWGPATSSGARLQVPEFNTPEPPIYAEKPKAAEAKPSVPPRPPAGDQAAASPSLPADIPGFLPVKEQVTSGQKPLEGGFDWLKSNGYSAVLSIHEPGDDISAEKRQAEERGLKFFHIEVSPKTFGRQIVEDFNRTVNEAANRPLFVYDRNGVLAGGLWYLHFRTVDRLSDDDARAKAKPLGLKTDGNDANKAMWVAIQEYLSKQAP